MIRILRSGGGLWMGAAASAGVLLTLELGLRALGFQYAHTPLSLRYVSAIAHIGHTQTTRRKTFHIDYGLDHTLLWKPLPTPGVTNSQGLLGEEWPREKAPSRKRVITLGDSCTIAGEDLYSARLQRLGRGRWEVLNAGVGSWSSYQGLKFLETRLLAFKPDFVSIYFGWNDHWLAWAVPDKKLAALLDRQWALRQAIAHSRLLQVLLKMAMRVRGGEPRFSAATPYRVAIEDYEANLRSMVAAVRRAGGEAVLVTAPTSLSADSPFTRRLCDETHNFFDASRLNGVHAAYNTRLRAVAAEMKAPLVDLEKDFAAQTAVESLFTDGIHLSEHGHQRAAAALARVLP